MNLFDAIICTASYEQHMHTFRQPGTTFGMTLNVVDREDRELGGIISQLIRRWAIFSIIHFSRRIHVVDVDGRSYPIIVDFVDSIGVEN
jgi:hypothetical protein